MEQGCGERSLFGVLKTKTKNCLRVQMGLELLVGLLNQLSLKGTTESQTMCGQKFNIRQFLCFWSVLWEGCVSFLWSRGTDCLSSYNFLYPPVQRSVNPHLLNLGFTGNKAKEDWKQTMDQPNYSQINSFRTRPSNFDFHGNHLGRHMFKTQIGEEPLGVSVG